ncbi:MAG: 30S ribosomal protein S15 [bacterium]
MAMTKQRKNELVESFKTHPTDTGSPEIQIALLTERINYLSDHFKSHGKDFHSRYGLLKIVSQRRRLLKYLKEHNPDKYKEIIGKLGIRK